MKQSFTPPTMQISVWKPSVLLLVQIKVTESCGCGFRHNRSTTYQTFCIHQILEKKWEYNETVHQLFTGFKKAYDSVRMAVLYNILIELGVSLKLVGLIEICLNETYSKALISKHLSDVFPTKWFQTRCFIAILFQPCFRICR
jgi:hypothetical protein